MCCSYQDPLGPAFPRAQRWPWDNTPGDIQVDPRSHLDSWPGHHVWQMGSSFTFKLKSSSREPSAMKFRCRWLHGYESGSDSDPSSAALLLVMFYRGSALARASTAVDQGRHFNHVPFDLASGAHVGARGEGTSSHMTCILKICPPQSRLTGVQKSPSTSTPLWDASVCLPHSL